jgi:hypothetical protein
MKPLLIIEKQTKQFRKGAKTHMKRTVFAILFSVLLLAARPLASAETASAAVPIGDTDGDGAITSRDASLLMQSIVGLAALEEDAASRADVNGDGSVAADDAARILRYCIRLTDDLETPRGGVRP